MYKDGGTLPQELRDLLSSATEPTESAKRESTLEEICAILDPYAREANAGVSDKHLQDLTRLPLSAIAEWRRFRGIDRKAYQTEHGLMPEQLEALDLFKDSEDYALQFVAASPVLGAWKPPQVLLRVHLDYDLLARYLHFLHREQGATFESLAAAFGLTATDTEMAIELYNRLLKERGQLCARCGTPTEGKFCTTRCRRRA